MKALKPVMPPIAIERAYHKKLKAMLKEMDNSLYYWLRAEYRKAEPEIVGDSAMADLRAKMKYLARYWDKKYNDEAAKLANWFASEVQKYSTRNLQQQFKQAKLAELGFDLKFTYHSRKERAVFNSIVEQNVNLIKSIASEHLTKVQGVVLRGIETGHDLSRMTQDLEQGFGVTERRAAMIARDQTAKASNNLSRQRLLDYGVTKGKWMHTSAGKTYRDSHVDMDGEIYDIEEGCYDDDYGDYVQPGELVNCHCVCIPVIGAENEAGEDVEAESYEPPTENEQNSLPVYEPAETIPEANSFMEKNFDITANYKGLDVEVANIVNDTMTSTFNDFPKLSEQFGFIGESHERMKIAKDNFKTFVEKELQKMGLVQGSKQYQDSLDFNLRSFAQKHRIPSNTYAISHSNGSGVFSDLNGITINNKQGKTAAAMKKSLQNDVKNGFHPVKCDTIKSVVDHEAGHQLDRLIGLADNEDFLKYYKSLSPDDITKGLSRYATTNIREFIAEGWSEYLNNPSPRPIAKKIGEFVKKVYKAKYGE